MDTEKYEKALIELDHFFSLLYRYEIHAFVLLITGVFLVLRGVKEEGFAVIGAALTVFKGNSAK